MAEAVDTQAGDAQPFGENRPNPIQRALIAVARKTFLRRGAFRKTVTRWILRLGRGQLDIEFRGAKFRIRGESNLIEYGLLLVPEYNAKDIEFLLENATARSNFVDLGSNIGLYSLPLAAACPQGRILSVDANAAMAKHLEWNAAASQLGNLTIVHAAVSDSEGRANLMIRKDDLAIVSVRRSDGGTVRMRTLAALVEEAALSEIHGLKIDIEGHEDRALVPFLDTAPPALLPRRIVIERPSRGGGYRGCTAAFARHGYVLMGHSQNNAFYLREANDTPATAPAHDAKA